MRKHWIDLLDLEWDFVPFESDLEKSQVKQFRKYLVDTHNLHEESLLPFEMAIFYLGNNKNDKVASENYLLFLQFKKDYKFDTVSKESLLKSMTLLKNGYSIGGTINLTIARNDNSGTSINDTSTDNKDDHDTKNKKCHIFGTAGCKLFPNKFDSVASMLKGMYFTLNEFNFLKRFNISRDCSIIVSDLKNLGMANFSISHQMPAIQLMQHIYPMTIDTIYLTNAPYLMIPIVNVIIKLIDTKNIKLKQTTMKNTLKQLNNDTSQIPIIIGGTFDESLLLEGRKTL